MELCLAHPRITPNTDTRLAVALVLAKGTRLGAPAGVRHLKQCWEGEFLYLQKRGYQHLYHLEQCWE